MLTFSVYEEAHRRALKRPRLEFRALAESVAAGRIPNAEIAVVISNREKRTRHPARGST